MKNAICTALQIASPSKVMVEIGKFVDQGLAKGIDKYSGDPTDSANDVATMLVYAMSNAMRMAEAALAEDTYTPTISPVIDLAQVQSGINEMNGMLYSADGYSLDAAMRSRYNPYENFDGTEKLDPTLGILGSVDGVTEKLDENNGLLLCAHHDALFDKHLISFDSSGDVIVSPTLSASEQTQLGIPSIPKITMTPAMDVYMAYHRAHLKK